MKHMHKILPLVLLLTACSEQQPFTDNGGKAMRLDISFADGQTRSWWSDLTDTEGKVSYVWKNEGDNMLTAIRHGAQYVPFYEDQASAPRYYSDTWFETVDVAKSKIRLRTMQSVKYDVEEGAYKYPVAVGDDMYCCHPVNEHTTVTGTQTSVYVDMQLPGTFAYGSLDNDLEQLSDYSYVYVATKLLSVDDTKVVAKKESFSSACAIIRFNITNNVTSDITLSDIRMGAEDESPIFPNVLRFEDGVMKEAGDDPSAYYSRITTSTGNLTIPRGSKGTFYNLCFPLDDGKDFNGVPLKFTIDTNYLTYQLCLSTGERTIAKFEAGKIYTFNFSLEEKEIRLNTIEVSLCTTYNTDNTESLNVLLSPDAVWDQSGSTMAQMVFVSLGMTTTIEEKEYDVLWATCNLGAKEPLETGNHYAWGEVAPKDASQYSPGGYKGTASSDISGTQHDAVKTYLGDGYWMWRMPTRDMWEDIITNCTWKWKTVKKVSEGTASEDNLDFDASVWEVRKLNAEGKTVGIIYFPITGYSGYDEKSGTYTKVNKARCHYWTSTPSGGAAGANETAWAFETLYSFNQNNGDMSRPILTDTCKRYNGFCIRPVLLREKK